MTGDPAPIDRDCIRKTLTGEQYRDAASKIVVKNISDWKHSSTHNVWAVLDRIMKKSPEMVAHERERVDNCIWWDDVAAKIPGFDKTGEVWHFHPVGFVSPMCTVKERWKLGATSERFETGGRGVATISTGSGDFGGVSYGSYQLSSNLGVVQKFIAQSSYKQDFSGLDVNSEKFKKKWREIAEREPEEFKASQHQFIKSTHYDVQMKFLAENGLEVNHKRASIHDMIWSTSVQFGPETKLIVKAIAGSDFSLLPDDAVVKMVQQFKHDKTETYFASSPKLWAGLKQRALQEKDALLKLVASADEIE